MSARGRRRSVRSAPSRAGPAGADGAYVTGPDRNFIPGEVTPRRAAAAERQRGARGARRAASDPGKRWFGVLFGPVAGPRYTDNRRAPGAPGAAGALAGQTLLALWKRLWLAAPSLPGGGQPASQFAALRLETLYRYGLISGLHERLGKPGGTDGVAAVVIKNATRIGLGDRERGCAKIRSVVRQISELPKLARADALLISGYCAVVEKNMSAASIAAELVHDQHAGASMGLAVLDALAAGNQPQGQVPGPLSLLDYRFLQLS